MSLAGTAWGGGGLAGVDEAAASNSEAEPTCAARIVLRRIVLRIADILMKHQCAIFWHFARWWRSSGRPTERTSFKTTKENSRTHCTCWPKHLQSSYPAGVTARDGTGEVGHSEGAWRRQECKVKTYNLFSFKVWVRNGNGPGRPPQYQWPERPRPWAFAQAIPTWCNCTPRASPFWCLSTAAHPL